MIPNKAVYAADWSPDGSAIVISEGTKIMTKSLQLRFYTRFSFRYELSCRKPEKAISTSRVLECARGADNGLSMGWERSNCIGQ